MSSRVRIHTLIISFFCSFGMIISGCSNQQMYHPDKFSSTPNPQTTPSAPPATRFIASQTPGSNTNTQVFSYSPTPIPEKTGTDPTPTTASTPNVPIQSGQITASIESNYPAFLLTFFTDGRMESIKADGSSRATLFTLEGFQKYPEGFLHSPKWSPNGEWLAFVGTSKNWWEDIHLIHPDGSGLVKITDTHETKGRLSWSPDGRMIVFDQTTWIGNFSHTDLYLVDVNTRKIIRLTHTEDTNEFSPSFSPSGKLIAFLRSETTNSSPHHLMRMDLETQSMDILVAADYHVTSFGWNPDGSKIIFASGAFSEVGQPCENLYLLDLSSSQITLLTRFFGETISSNWSPDGQAAAFTRTPCNGTPGSIQVDMVNPITGQIDNVANFDSFQMTGIDWYPLPFLEVDNVYTITTLGNNLNLRKSPGLAGQVALKLQEGEQIKVLEGPIDKDQFHWWHIEITKTGEQGWVAENLGWFKPK